MPRFIHSILNDWYNRLLLLAGVGALIAYLAETHSLWWTIGFLAVLVGGGGAGLLWARAIFQSQPIWGSERLKGPTHSDPDVQALLRKEITLLDYGDRKAREQSKHGQDIQPSAPADRPQAGGR